MKIKRRPRFSLSVGGPDASESVAEAVAAEKLGYDFVWVADHLADIPQITAVFDAWTMLAYVGARTRSISLASGVTDIQRTHPAKTASSVATLDNLTKGRAVLGIGAGEVMNVRPYGMRWEPPATRIKRFREYLKVMLSLWATSYHRPVSLRGHFYALRDAHLGLQPVRKPHPPIYVGAFASDKMLTVAGELADGWFPGAFYDPVHFGKKVNVIRQGAEKARRNFGHFDVMANIPVIINPSHRGMKLVREKFKRSLVINKYMLKLLGEEEAYGFVSRQLQYQLITPTPRYERVLQKAVRELPISEDSIDRGLAEMMAVGDIEHCVETFERFLKAGATHLHVSSFMSDQKTYRVVADRIVPRFG